MWCNIQVIQISKNLLSAWHRWTPTELFPPPWKESIVIYCWIVMLYSNSPKSFMKWSLLTHTLSWRRTTRVSSATVRRVRRREKRTSRHLERGISMETRQSKHCGFCIYLFDNSFDQSKYIVRAEKLLFSGLVFAVQGCAGRYWAVLGCTGLYSAVLGCTKL